MSFFDEIKKLFIELFNSFKNEIIQEIILIKYLPNDREKELEEINCKLQQEIILLRQELEMFYSKKNVQIIEPWELFNTNTKIRFNIRNYYHATINVSNKNIIFSGKFYNTLDDVYKRIQDILTIQLVTIQLDSTCYNNLEWYNINTNMWVSASDTFTRDFLEKNGKQN